MPGEHALLSSSGAKRWLTCTPSARLEEKMQEETSTYADEGTLAHWLGETLIKRKLRILTKRAYDTQLESIKANSLYNKSMWDYCEGYAAYVIEKYNEALARCPGARIYLEFRLNMARFIPEGFGTGDVIIAADAEMTFIDLKYGTGVKIAAEENEQLKIYGLGAYDEFNLLYDIRSVSLTIYQPRINNISTWKISVKDLLSWAKKVVIPRAKLAFEGKGEFAPGSHCQFCRVKTTCKANADYHFELTTYEFADPELLNPRDVSDILTRREGFLNWINAVEDYALQQAIAKGANWPGYKLVEGRSNRIYKDEKKVLKTLLKAGYLDIDLHEPKKLKGITKMEEELGPADFNAHLSDLLYKPYGKPTLVPVTDGRERWDRSAEALIIFAE